MLDKPLSMDLILITYESRGSSQCTPGGGFPSIAYIAEAHAFLAQTQTASNFTPPLQLWLRNDGTGTVPSEWIKILTFTGSNRVFKVEAGRIVQHTTC